MLLMDNQENIENLRVASFSAYLNSSEENFVLKITGAVKDHSLDLEPPEMTLSRISSEKGKTDHEGEIDIFTADKYFSTRMELEAPKPINYNKMNLAEVDRKQSSTKAPSVFSNASSNCQRPLLPKLSKNPSPVKQRSRNGWRSFIGFGCNGRCLKKKWVHIDQGAENGCLIQKNDQQKKESFRFANTMVPDAEKSCQMGLKGGDNFEFLVPKAKEEILVRVEEPRQSIEVFGSSRKKRDDQMEKNLEGKLSMLTWDAIPKTQNQAPTMGSGPFDDNQSDASSDLFEIETLSGNGSTFLTNQGSEKISYCMSPTTHYAPSEASIEWSIVTASAADFSFASEYDEKSIAGDFTSKAGKMKDTEQKEGQIKCHGALLGCRSDKAVSVAETVQKSADKAKFIEESKLQGRVCKNEIEFAPIF